MHPDTLLETPFGNTLQLHSWPQGRNLAVQAWDGLDRLFLHQFAARHGTSARTVWVLEERFGALSVALASAGHQVFAACDSANGVRALGENSARAVTAGRQPQVSVAPLPVEAPPPDLVLLRCPRSLSLLSALLSQLSYACAPGTPVWVGAVDKHMPNGMVQLLQDKMDLSERPPGRFKAHLYDCSVRPEKSPAVKPAGYPVPELGVSLQAAPGVFAQHHPDPGGRFLCAHLPAGQARAHRVFDLGCGNGLLGIAYARANPGACVYFFDDSARALRCARANAESLVPLSQRGGFYHCHGLEGAPLKADVVLLNPPFHRGNAVDARIGAELLRHAGEGLLPGGQLALVCNRHLDYRSELDAFFSHRELIASNRKFLVVHARR